MSVTYVKGSSPLGSLGSLTGAVGTLTGNPWLTALGTGMGAVGSMMNGNSNPQSVSTLQEALKGVLGWENPASGNIAKAAPGVGTHILDYMRKNYGGTY